MKERQTTIQWSLNIVLIFLIACRFSPISSMFISSLFINVMSGYLIVILNILISNYANKCEQGINNRVAMIFNCILAISFICSTTLDFSESREITSIVQILLMGCSYLICYFIVMKFGTKKYATIVLALSLISIFVATEVQYGYTVKQLMARKKSYTFVDEETYRHFKKRYREFGKYSPYSVLNYSNDSIYVQNLIYGDTEYFSFATKSERDDFVEKYTMGTDIRVPVIGPNAKFIDKEKTVLSSDYALSVMDEMREMKQYSIFYFMALMGVESLLFLVGYAYEKKKKINM